MGNIDAVTWDKNALKLAVEAYEDGTKINWTELARRYEITNKKGQIAKNGGQIAQEWLTSQGVNLHRFKRPSTADRQPRRKKLKGLHPCKNSAYFISILYVFFKVFFSYFFVFFLYFQDYFKVIFLPILNLLF